MAVIIVVAMTAKLTAALRESPATVPALAALALFVVWATDQAGYPLTHWAPGGILILALLALDASATVGLRLARGRRCPCACRSAASPPTPPSATSRSCGRGDQGAAWEGANRTLLYLLVFALFACWRQRGATARPAARRLGARDDRARGLRRPARGRRRRAGASQTLLPGGRLLYPSGYPNANAAQWLMAFWPALLLARSEPAALGAAGPARGGRGAARGRRAAQPEPRLVLCDARDARARLRAAAGAAAHVRAARARSAPRSRRPRRRCSRVGDHLRAGAVVPEPRRRRRSLRCSRRRSPSGSSSPLGAALESGHRLGSAARGARAHGRERRRRGGARRGAGGRARGGRQPGAPRRKARGTASRAATGRHAGREPARERPREQPLRLLPGRARRVPRASRWRGSAPTTTSSSTSATAAATRRRATPTASSCARSRRPACSAALLALAGLAAALLAAGARAARATSRSPRAVAAAALGGFAYWLVHGSVRLVLRVRGAGRARVCDARPGLRARAPERARCAAPERTSARSRPGGGGRRPGAAAGGGRARRARARARARRAVAEPPAGRAPPRIWTRAPRRAYARLDDAASLNPLSDEAYLRRRQHRAALRAARSAPTATSRCALRRTPDDAYATLERGAIASARGERARALALLRRAVALSPAGPARAKRAGAHAARRGGGRGELNRLILLKAQQLA